MLMGPSGSGNKARAATGERAFPPLPGLPHFPGKAKALIYLHMNGGPTQLDLWDYKPACSSSLTRTCPTACGWASGSRR